MRGLRVLILVGATASAAVAMWAMQSAIQSQANTRPAPQQVSAVPEPAVPLPETVEVLIANQRIPTGRRMTPEDLAWQPWPVDSVADTFFVRAEEPEAIANLEGAASRLTIEKGEPVTGPKVVALNGAGVMSSLLRPGMRAVAVPINEISAAGGFVLPGDFVDVLLTRQIEIEKIDEVTGEVVDTETHNDTETVMAHVRVLAIDQQLNEGTQTAALGSSATLELMPEQVELITLTRQIAQKDRGFITLSLRSFAEMVEEYGEDIENVMPETVVDLSEGVERKRREAADARALFESRPKTPEAVEGTEVAETEPVEAAPAAAPSTVTLIRNGRPIVVHTIKPQTEGQ